MDAIKRCTSCKIEKATTEFYARFDRSGGFQPQCKACSSAKHKAWYAANRQKVKRHIPDKKRCWKCKQSFAVSAFGFCRAYPDGLNPQCKSCAREYAKTIGNPAALARDPHRSHGRRWYLYRLRPGQFDEMRQAQGNACAICRGEFMKTPYVDHCHKTGKIRGLLCAPCNAGLGFIERNGYLASALRYLEQTGGY